MCLVGEVTTLVSLIFLSNVGFLCNKRKEKKIFEHQKIENWRKNWKSTTLKKLPVTYDFLVKDDQKLVVY